MHSKSKIRVSANTTETKSVFRLTPYLITAGIGFAMASPAVSASPEEEGAAEMAPGQQRAAPEAPLESEIPAPTMDTNADGTSDAWDRNGDQKPDAWDTNGDGKPDLLDDNGDGKPDQARLILIKKQRRMI